jgi:hypothetical protein
MIKKVPVQITVCVEYDTEFPAQCDALCGGLWEDAEDRFRCEYFKTPLSNVKAGPHWLGAKRCDECLAATLKEKGN